MPLFQTGSYTKSNTMSMS
ncbi:hypothetical protein F383_16399 [Gossypium arboreum]|nr:hypothetical protein F383_16399 [Gossypium arboreum]